MALETKKTRIGIFAGTFNPVYAGHISFALQAREAANLDEVYFLPERMPRHKIAVEHYGHRVAMLERAVRPYNNLAVIEVVDKHLSVHRTLPQLQRIYGDNAQLVLLSGADVFNDMPDWPGMIRIIDTLEFAVSIRSGRELRTVLNIVQLLGMPSKALTVIDSMEPDINGSLIRNAISLNVPVRGLLPSVHRYARQEWLYVELPHKN